MIPLYPFTLLPYFLKFNYSQNVLINKLIRFELCFSVTATKV